MAAQYHSLFTTQGLELLREAIQNGTKLGITHMSYGDGNGALPVPDASFTKMVKEVYRTPLNRLAASKENPNWLEADGVIPSAVGGFNIREVGLWAGNVMVAYANYPPTYKPSADQGTAQIKTIRIVLQIDNTANFELKIDASVVMATVEYVNDAMNKTNISVNNISDLKNELINLNKIVYVKSVNKNYSYIEESEFADNGYSIIQSNTEGFWEMETLEYYYASSFAQANIQEDQSKRIQDGYAYATKKQRKFIVDNIFYVKSINKTPNTTLNIPTALYILSNSHIEFISNGEIRLLTTHVVLSNIVIAINVENYEITRPKLTGDRRSNNLIDKSEGTAEWGYGLTIYTSKNGYIFEPDIKDCMGDGLYIGKAWGSNTTNVPEDIKIIRPKIDRVRRNGISLTNGKNVYIQKPIISNVTDIDGIQSTGPSSGIDLEPESALTDPRPIIDDCIIEDPVFINCKIHLNFWNQYPGAKMKVHIKGIMNVYSDFSDASGLWIGNEENDIEGYLKIDMIQFNSHIDQAIYTKLIKKPTFKINIAEVKNNTDSVLDIIYGQMNSPLANFGSLEIEKLTVTNSTTASWTVAHNYSKSSQTSDLIIRNVLCNFGLYMASASNSPQRGSDYFVGITSKAQTSIDSLFIPGSSVSHNPSTADSEIYMNKSFNVQKIMLDPLSVNPLLITGLSFDNINGVAKSKIKLTKPGSFVVLQKVNSGQTKLVEASGTWEFL